MASKPDNLELALPGAILDLGIALTAQHVTKGRISGASPAVQKDASLEDRVLALAMADPTARKLIGLREQGQSEAERRLRLRTMAILAYAFLHETPRGPVEMAVLAEAVMDASQPPGEALLVARHAIGKMAVEGVVKTVPSGPYNWTVGVIPQGKAVQWLAGGNATLGILTPQRLASRKGEAVDEEADIAAPVPLPAKVIRNRLAERVVGLDGQLDILAGRLALHMARARLLAAGEDTGTPNECVLVLGESGTGKTWLCEQSGWATGLPHAACNAAEMTASGYVGLSADDGLRELITAAKGRVEAARFGVMCYDEMLKRGASANDSPVNSTAVQNEMLRIVQGQATQIGGKRSGYETVLWMDTRGTFFFLAGHAPGLDRLIERRLGRKTIGFGSGGPREGNRGVLLDALEDYGMIPELLNRLTAVLAIPPPRLCDLIRAATAGNGVIAGYNRLLTARGCMLRFDNGAVRELAAHCLSSRLYYRGLAAIVSALAADAVTQGEGRTLKVQAVDIQRTVARMDEAANDLLQGASRQDAPSDSEPGDGIVADNLGVRLATG